MYKRHQKGGVKAPSLSRQGSPGRSDMNQTPQSYPRNNGRKKKRGLGPIGNFLISMFVHRNLAEAVTAEQSAKMRALRTFDGTLVNVVLHSSLNVVKGVVYSR